VIQLGLVLALVTSLLGAGVWIVQSIKDQGREECKAEHAEASRMAELRQRERGVSAARGYEAGNATRAARERTIAPQVASAVARDTGSCIDDGMRGLINDDIRQGRGSSEPK
jgi:type II secretory pathway pseudopilin PulG